jgi:hypothetical protein
LHKIFYAKLCKSVFGGLLGLVKFLDLVKFREIFEGFYKPPERMPEMGHYQMVYGLLFLLFIGFTRVWHFLYIQFDAVVCGVFNRVKLPYVTTYWRYVDSLGINQGMSLLMVMSAFRERVWQLCGLSYSTIHINIDTTVETIYGSQQGGRKGHNPKNRPIPGDYNGDGTMERGFYRGAQNWWFLEGQSDFVWGYDGATFMPITSQVNVFNWFRFMLGRFQ